MCFLLFLSYKRVRTITAHVCFPPEVWFGKLYVNPETNKHLYSTTLELLFNSDQYKCKKIMCVPIFAGKSVPQESENMLMHTQSQISIAHLSEHFKTLIEDFQTLTRY